jgi:hypothetical protein
MCAPYMYPSKCRSTYFVQSLCRGTGPMVQNDEWPTPGLNVQVLLAYTPCPLIVYQLHSTRSSDSLIRQGGLIENAASSAGCWYRLLIYGSYEMFWRALLFGVCALPLPCFTIFIDPNFLCGASGDLRIHKLLLLDK